MTAILTDRSAAAVQLSFTRACVQLTEARWLRAVKDSPSSRLQVEVCRARVDAILDAWNEAHRVLA